jgi:hypothetical protein
VAEATTAESSKRVLIEVLGVERRDRILSALYLARQDAVSVVRTSSIHIWKALVANTPRTGMFQAFAIRASLMFSYSPRDFASAHGPNYIPNLWCRVRAARGILFMNSGDSIDSNLLQTAGRTTAELCRKFGEKILAELIPILRSKSASADSRTREGVCLTLCEMM